MYDQFQFYDGWVEADLYELPKLSSCIYMIVDIDGSMNYILQNDDYLEEL